MIIKLDNMKPDTMNNNEMILSIIQKLIKMERIMI